MEFSGEKCLLCRDVSLFFHKKESSQQKGLIHPYMHHRCVWGGMLGMAGQPELSFLSWQHTSATVSVWGILCYSRCTIRWNLWLLEVNLGFSCSKFPHSFWRSLFLSWTNAKSGHSIWLHNVPMLFQIAALCYISWVLPHRQFTISLQFNLHHTGLTYYLTGYHTFLYDSQITVRSPSPCGTCFYSTATGSLKQKEKKKEKASLLIHHDTYTLILFYWRDFIRAIISWFT